MVQGDSGRERFGNQNFKGRSSNSGHLRGGSGQFYKRRGRFGQNKPQCQLCLRFGHTIFNCYCRFDQSFQRSPTGSPTVPQHQLRANFDAASSQPQMDSFMPESD